MSATKKRKVDEHAGTQCVQCNKSLRRNSGRSIGCNCDAKVHTRCARAFSSTGITRYPSISPWSLPYENPNNAHWLMVNAPWRCPSCGDALDASPLQVMRQQALMKAWKANSSAQWVYSCNLSTRKAFIWHRTRDKVAALEQFKDRTRAFAACIEPGHPRLANKLRRFAETGNVTIVSESIGSKWG